VRPAWLLLLIPIGLVGAGQWARGKNAERDAGITWVWAYSPRTMQSYLVRAHLNAADGTVSFQLEDPGTAYEFADCHPPEGPDSVDHCTDQRGQAWDLQL
jgi:hypothetical protein